MKVLISTPLHDYTGGNYEVEAGGATLAALFTELDQRYPGIRFRMVDEQDAIRGHIRVFVNGESVRDMSTALNKPDEVLIVQALSGG